MPHKHKRKRGEDEAEFDLPPTQNARPLPVKNKNGSIAQDPRPTKQQRKGRAKNDDVPRAFKRLMAVAQGKTIRSGLDDGSKGKATKTPAPEHEAPRIRPGEDLRSFAARVDTSIPVSGLTRKIKTVNGKDEQGLKVHRTRKERQMHKLYDQWREEERKIQEQREEELEKIAEKDLENDAAGIMTSKAFADENANLSGKKRRKKKGKGRGSASDDEDPWDALKKKRAEAKVGLHDVAQAPPELHKKTAKLLEVGGASVDVQNIPKSAGSLRRREELQAARNDVMEKLRKIREHEQTKLNALRDR
ncbi:hypothetical protein ESCO_002560 [Escovopsis weberi]|uniref:Urease accessory protein UreD n=1 Tax=Escovopsis weberi TaxID=150374 RepID=A0A0M9VSK6_ESCWE|nr:hypothetical protein ESCO_002560 [Escovopsis weberi]